MNIFLDTSTLIKLYFFEEGTLSLETFLSDNDINFIFLSEIAKLEFESTLWKKVRTKELEEKNALASIEAFENDKNKFKFIPINSSILQSAKTLISKYGKTGLRTLDSIQLSSSIEVKDLTEKYFTSDKTLLDIFIQEGLPI
jgi:uncharacterized protein